MMAERFRKFSIGAAVLASAGLAGCGMGSLTSGIGGGLFGGGAAGKTDQAASGITTESMLTAAKTDGNAGSDVAGGCPRFTVFSRDSNVTIYEPGRVGDALGVVHRGEITKTARECSVENGRVTVKYGFSGRILLGPKGKTGNVALPLAVFVTDSKKERVANDRMRVDVPVALDKPIGYFSTVREVSFPLPEGSRPGEFEVFVGFERNIPNAG
jgi:outer membrane murein-binding lipoprotein Lpp